MAGNNRSRFTPPCTNFLCRCRCGRELTVPQYKLLSGRIKSCGCIRHRRRSADLTGQTFGRLTVIEPTEQKKRGATLWRCRCECGSEILALAHGLQSGNTSSCGCARKGKNMLELTGQRFGRLVALERLDEKKGSGYLWKCQCDCGKITKVPANSLAQGGIRSCGCGRVDAMKQTIEQRGTVADHARLIDGTNVDLIERKGLRRNNTSGYTGVQAKGDRWIALITFKKKVYYLGTFTKIEDAVEARKQAEERIFGEFLEWYYQEHPRK